MKFRCSFCNADMIKKKHEVVKEGLLCQFWECLVCGHNFYLFPKKETKDDGQQSKPPG